MVSAGGTPSDHSGPTDVGAEGGVDYLAPGTMVGEYRVTTKLSEGGMGEVYAGVHPLIDKKVAIKVIRRALGIGSFACGRSRPGLPYRLRGASGSSGT